MLKYTLPVMQEDCLSELKSCVTEPAQFKPGKPDRKKLKKCHKEFKKCVKAGEGSGMAL